MGGGVEFAEAVERPEGMDGGGVGGGLSHQLAEGRGEVLLLAFDDQALGAEAAILRATGETGEELGGGFALGGLGDGAGLVPDDAIDTAAGVVTQVVLVRATDTGLGVVTAAVHARGRVVLDDEVLPVGEPDGAIGTDLGEDRGHPFVGAGDKAVAVLGDVAGAGGLDVHEADELHRRLADHRLALQTLRQVRRVDEGRSSRSGPAAHHVDLTEVRGDRMRLVDDVDLLGRHAAGTLGPGRGRDAAEEDRGVVGRTTEGVAGRIGAVTPGVVGELVEELELGAIRGEAVAAHREVLLLAADLAGEAAVADRAAEPVVIAVRKAARLGVGIADAPARDDDLTDVGLVVAIVVLEEDEIRGLRDDHAAVGEDEARRDVELVGEDRELVGLAVAVGVFADLDGVIALLLVFHDAVRVVAGLGDPEAATGIPGERDRLHDVGLGSEEHQLQIGGDLRALHAALDGERLLEGQRLGALLVVGDVAVLLTDLGLALGEERLPGGLAVGRERGFELGTESGRGGVGLDDEHREGGDGGGGFHRQDVVTRERGGVGSRAGRVVEPDRIAAELSHQRVQRADGGLLFARGVEIEDADRTRGRRGGGEDGEVGRQEGDEGAHRGVQQAKVWKVRKQPVESSKTGQSRPRQRLDCRKNKRTRRAAAHSAKKNGAQMGAVFRERSLSDLSGRGGRDHPRQACCPRACP